MPRVSVLIPAWNAAGSIERALASVLDDPAIGASTELECIVVDDASTDATTAIVGRRAERDPRLRLIALTENAGASAARNAGLSAVTGDWLTLLDADDRFAPGGLATLVGAIAPDVLAVVGQQVWIEAGSSRIGPLYDIPDIREPGRKSIAANPGLLYFVSPHAKLIHRSCFEGLQFEGRVLGDQPWVIRSLLRAGDGIEVIRETVYEWLREPATPGQASITAATRASAARGVDAAAIAQRAFVEVGAEVDVQVPDPVARDRVRSVYAERLLRSDLAAHLRGALRRRDSATAVLLDAIRAFVAALPPGVLRASDALPRDILEPVLRRWLGLEPAARRSFWRLHEAALRAEPDLPAHASSAIAGSALHLVAGGRAGRPIGIAIMLAIQAGHLVRRLARPR
jgi:hypothetical protein